MVTRATGNDRVGRQAETTAARSGGLANSALLTRAVRSVS
jgi:hypothetical protein